MSLCLCQILDISQILKAQPSEKVELEARLCPTSLRTNVSYEFGFIVVANFIVMVALPACLLAFFNIRLFQAVKVGRNLFQVSHLTECFMFQKSGANLGLTSQEMIFRHRRDKKLARLLVLLVILFGVCNLPRVVVNVVEFSFRVTFGKNFPWPPW